MRKLPSRNNTREFLLSRKLISFNPYDARDYPFGQFSVLNHIDAATKHFAQTFPTLLDIMQFAIISDIKTENFSTFRFK